jgi:hypothetical protein
MPRKNNMECARCLEKKEYKILTEIRVLKLLFKINKTIDIYIYEGFLAVSRRRISPSRWINDYDDIVQ